MPENLASVVSRKKKQSEMSTLILPKLALNVVKVMQDLLFRTVSYFPGDRSNHFRV